MLDIPPNDLAGHGNPSFPASPKDHIPLITHTIASLTPSLRSLSLAIHDDPELRYKEVHAHELLTEFMRKQREERGQEWHVTPSAYGVGTAFVAVFEGEGEGPVVSFNAEYGMFFFPSHSWVGVEGFGVEGDC